jgi:hypothetical protein
MVFQNATRLHEAERAELVLLVFAIALARGRAIITKTFGKQAAAMEEAAAVLSKEEWLILLRLLKKTGKGKAG